MCSQFGLLQASVLLRLSDDLGGSKFDVAVLSHGAAPEPLRFLLQPKIACGDLGVLSLGSSSFFCKGSSTALQRQAIDRLAI